MRSEEQKLGMYSIGRVRCRHTRLFMSVVKVPVDAARFEGWADLRLLYGEEVEGLLTRAGILSGEDQDCRSSSAQVVEWMLYLQMLLAVGLESE